MYKTLHYQVFSKKKKEFLGQKKGFAFMYT